MCRNVYDLLPYKILTFLPPMVYDYVTICRAEHRFSAVMLLYSLQKCDMKKFCIVFDDVLSH
jgi:hypothetical protein